MATIHELCVRADGFKNDIELFLKKVYLSFFYKNNDIISNNNIYNNNIIIINNIVRQPIGDLKVTIKPPQGYLKNIPGGA
ncbi:hypothetical protein [Methanobacterium sp.]|uniref:hypothetical protein n=1 Tax=Methanobacterium sp. TaxID=2164 RepID=UPI002AB9CD1D|nr:hypothetical protein [Methanobacterium sp.]MDY9922742.1 hypothetical protein [Methanobacterium sp.]